MSETQYSYTWMRARAPESVLTPTSVDELGRILKQCNDEGRSMLVRAGENHMDDQGLTRGVSVSLRRMPTLDQDSSLFEVLQDGPNGTQGVPAVKLMRVAAWLTWGEVLCEALKHRVLPYVMVSCSRITVGGSIAGDGLSRFSPMVDKEAHHILRMEVLLPRDGKAVTLVHPDYYRSHHRPADALDEDDNRNLFYAIIGGHGLIGIVTSVTYWVAELPDAWTDVESIRVRSTVVRYDEYLDAFRDLDTGFRDIARGRRTRFSTPDGPRDYPMGAKHLVALFGAGAINAWIADADRERFTVWRSELVYGEKARPFRGFNQGDNIGLLAFGLRAVPEVDGFIARQVWGATRRGAARPGEEMKRPWVDDLRPYTFFFDAHKMAEKLNLDEHRRYTPGSLQQTFSLPADPAAADRFLNRAQKILASTDDDKPRDVVPQVLDAMFLPKHESVLAPNPTHDGYAITMAFEGVRQQASYRRSVERAMERISRLCLEFGGAVHLTKNLYMDDDTMRDMYADQFERFRRIKELADPNSVLRSDLWDRMRRVMGW